MKTSVVPQKSIWDLLSDTSPSDTLALDEHGIPTEEAILDYLDDALRAEVRKELERIADENAFFGDRLGKRQAQRTEREQSLLARISKADSTPKLVIQLTPPAENFLFISRIMHIAAAEKRGGGVQTTDSSGRVTFAVEQIKDESGKTHLELRIRVPRDKRLFETSGLFELLVDERAVLQHSVQLSKGKYVGRIAVQAIDVETERVRYQLTLKDTA